MKTLTFIKHFATKPRACTLSEIPSAIRARLQLEKGDCRTEQKEISIRLPYEVWEPRDFPEWETISQYYKYNCHLRHYLCMAGWDCAGRTKVRYLVTKTTINPTAITHAIESYKKWKIDVLSWDYEAAKDTLEHAKQMMQKYSKLLKSLKECA